MAKSKPICWMLYTPNIPKLTILNNALLNAQIIYIEKTMTWYVASIIMSIKKRSGKQRNIPVYENFILIQSDSAINAMEKAVELGEKSAAIESEGLLLNDKPARMVFEGVRKLITISNPAEMDLDNSPPCTGTELTYSEYVVTTPTQIKRLVKGEPVKLKYID
ncbi:DUF4288 domain-containing protein [Orbaceae bacterium ac157xtp]